MDIRAEYAADDPRHHTRKIEEIPHGSMQHIWEDIARVDDPKAQALSCKAVTQHASKHPAS